MTYKRAASYSKVHQPDPSRFWMLVRNIHIRHKLYGDPMPNVGDHILYVYDIRGTREEPMHDILVNIAQGDKYKLHNDHVGEKTSMPVPVQNLMAEMFKLPTEDTSKFETRVGYVQEVCYDKVLEETYIVINKERGWGSLCPNPDCVVYWAPFPAPPNTYTPLENPEFWSDLEGARIRETRIQDYLETRAARKNR